MPVFWELLARLIEFDIQWLISLVLHNFFWVFAFGAMAFYYYPKHNMTATALVIILFIWAFIDMTSVFGWLYLVAGFLAFNYISRFTVLTFTENDKILKNHTVVIMIILFWVTWVYFNIFMR